jgi:hypothetical protein
MKNKKKIAVVGAGLFGCTIALLLSKKFDVDLFDRKPNILNEASMCNQFRFHEGFHYPRSVKTVNEVKSANRKFINFYGDDVFGKTNNYYGVAKNYSQTNFKSYLNFLNKNKLKFKIKKNSKLISTNVEGVITSNELNLDYFKIKKIIENKIDKSSIKLKLSSQLDSSIIKYKRYDKIILCAYKNNNNILKNLGYRIYNKFRYELIEKIIIKLPKIYKKISFVILDGNFVCVDPYLGTPYHLLSHVKHSKLKIINKKFCKFSKQYDKLLVDVKFNNKKKSRFDQFITDGSKYLPFLKKAQYIYSYLVVRTIKSNVEKTSERTNLIQKEGDKIITVLGGKWNTCVSVAKQINQMI